MTATPKASWPWVKALLHSVHDQPDADAEHAQFDRVVAALLLVGAVLGVRLITALISAVRDRRAWA